MELKCNVQLYPRTLIVQQIEAVKSWIVDSGLIFSDIFGRYH